MSSIRSRKLKSRVLYISVILALLLSLVPQALPGVDVPTAEAHNLQTRMVYTFFDPETQQLLDDRIASPGWAPPTPLLQAGDELGIIIKVVPRDGTTTGVGGHIDFYVPNGTQVVDVGYVVPNGSGGFDKVAMKGQSPIAIGSGSIGATATSQLIGLTNVYNSPVSDLSSTAVNPATGLHLGTIAGLYGDTGIFFSTDPNTAYGSWQTLTGASTANGCGALAFNPSALGPRITNNSGDVVVPCNAWDAGQLFAWGVKGTTYTGPGASSAPIVDYGDGRGNAPWGFANGVAGPQSGYAWAFDWFEWRSSAQNAAAMREAMSTDSIGPWQRIRYPGSRISYDQPGLVSSVIGYANRDASTIGRDLTTNPLPVTHPTTGQTDLTSPKAIRWAVGQLTAFRPEYAWVKIKVTGDTTAITNSGSCINFNLRADTFGGDAGGTDNGKDHLWRYYEPTEVKMNMCVGAGKPATREFVKTGAIYQYPVKVYNLQNFTLTNVVVRDTLGSGLAFVSAVPAQNSGPNPLVWNVGTLLPGQKFESLVTVRATSTGFLDNCVTIFSDQLPPQSVCDTTISGNYPYLVPTKTVRSSSVAAGGTVIYDVLVSNIGTGPTGNPVTVREFLPEGFTYDPTFTPVVTVNGALVTATVDASNPNQPVFTIPAAVQAERDLTIAFRAKVALTTQPGSYCNTYSVTQNGVPITTGSLACVTVAGGKIGDTIWRDWNGNGVQDAGEEGIAGVTVKLFASDGTTLLATTTTDANGNYFFPGLTASTYVVEVNNGSPLPGTVQSGDPDSTCPSAGCDNRHTVTLAANQQYLTADFGYKPVGAGVIGDTVFEDVGNDGAFTVGTDTGIPGVTVYLYEDANGDGIIDPATDALVATTTTGAGGIYSFTGLAQGYDYIAYVDPSDPALAAYFGVPIQASTPNPQPVPNLTGAYNDADFGFWRVAPGSIGDQVFVDNNANGIFDAGDSPLAGVTVVLLRNGEPVASTVTDSGGMYLFGNLGPGNYTVLVDPDSAGVPAGYFPTVAQYNVTLTAGQQFLDADFPFRGGLTKTATPAFVPPGSNITFSLRPYYPGLEPLENVRVFDPLPTGTTYVAGSANLGGTFGAYTPLPAEPAVDTEGGPLGTTTLNTAVTISTNFVNTGGSVIVTLNVKQNSGSTVFNVAPMDFEVSGGAYTILSGPTPLSQGVPTGVTGANFVWTVRLDEPGEYIFSAAAEDATEDYSWPLASSSSVLSAPDGGPNVVTWSLGTTTPRIPAETVTSGSPAGIFGLRGDNTTVFSRFGLASGAWTGRAAFPVGNVGWGGSLTSDGVQTIYGLRGNGQQTFASYDVVSNSWTTRANTGVNVSEGGAIVFLKVGGVDYVYALMGKGTAFRRWQVVAGAGSWEARAAVPATVGKGGALTTDGAYIYALTGDVKPSKRKFYRYDPVANTWTARADTPADMGEGAALVHLGGYIYALRGKDTNVFYRYDIATNTWTTRANTPNKVKAGGALTTDGAFIYALQGKDQTGFWRYNPQLNSWSVLPTYPATVFQGGALTYVPAAAVNSRLNVMAASPRLVSTGDKIVVTITLTSDAAINNIVPGAVTVAPVGTATPDHPNWILVSADDDISGTGDSVVFRRTYTAAPGAAIRNITFTAGATGDGPVTFNPATTASVIASPALTFQATVNTGAPAVIRNTGILAETGGVFGSIPSNTTETATSGSIGDRVWLDGNGNGVQDPGEVGVPGVQVCVYQSDGITLVGCDTTDVNGLYRVFGLGAGNYVVKIDPNALLPNYFPTTPVSLNVALAANQQYNDADFGVRPPGTASIGDFIWLDANNDGVQDPGENGLPGIGVTLEINLGGVWYPVASTTTDAGGLYQFTGLVAGNYRVTVDPNSQVTSPYASGTFNLGSVMAPTYDLDGVGTPNVTLVTLATSSTVVNNVDFGYNWSGSIGDFVWWDYNANGLQDESPLEGIADARVQLYFDVNGDGVFSPLDGDYEIKRVFTDASGYYLFQNLPPGTYIVDVYEDSITTNGVRDVVPTTVDQLPVVLTPGSMTINTADFGYYRGARVAGSVFHDDDRNGIREAGDNGLAGITVTLTGTDTFGNPVSRTVVTDASGNFVIIVPEGNYTLTYNTAQTTAAGYPDPTTVTSFTFFAEAGEDWFENNSFHFGVDYSGSIGDRVWNDANGNGQQNAGEQGIPGVTVELYNAAGTVLLATTVTDANGNYFFPGLANGSYVVKVNPATLPSGFVATGEGEPGTPCASLPGGVCDNSITAVVSGGAANNSVDFGYRNPASYSVSGRVFDDLDSSGAYNPGEGLADVTVCLYDSTGATVLACTVTDINGAYTFLGVPNGSYVVKVDTTTLPSPAYVQTVDPDGTLNSQTPVTVSGAPVSNLNFGYELRPGSISGVVCDGDGDGLCNDPGDMPLAGVTVILTWAGPDGVLGTPDDVAYSDVTDSSGAYSFNDLNPGLYQITKINPPEYPFSIADADGGNPNSITLTLGVDEIRTNQDFEVDPAPSSIGDRVWLDENGNGVQDAGEAGIANVVVRLYAANGTTLLATTVTDSNGNYIFAGLLPGTYVVKVDPTSMPAGLAANQTFDPDATVDNQTTVLLTAGVEWTTADFGYNWVPPTVSVNPPPGATGAIGDRLWVDVDGDGVQDPGEPGLSGVTVQLYSDPDGNGVYDTLAASTTTDANGNYIFDDLAAGAYVIVVNGGVTPAGYTQTGDPDAFGQPCVTCDNRTTQPVILAPGDVFVNADFGYRPTQSSTIGDLIYLDLNGNGQHDAGEPGIPGVTVALLNNSGNVIATTTTDAAGAYTFAGLPAGVYTVWVNDTANVLGLLVQTGDPDATLDDRHTLTVNGTASYLDNDFGYAPAGQTPATGMIGDTIFLDGNGNNAFDPGEGLEGVTIRLYDATGTLLLATTTTDENGNYYFGGLAGATYVVRVDTATLPNGGAGLSNTIDPDGDTPDESKVVISGGAINLDQDFGYAANQPNTISGTIWNDVNANGALNGSETGRYAGVTVVLYDADGNVVATTTTNGSGNYSFTGLPAGSYTVDVTDDANVLNGLWHSLGTPGVPGQSQTDPYTVTLSGGQTVVVDYGYYSAAATLGDWVWDDANQNGIQDPGELGLAGVLVTLTINYPNGDTATATVVTDANGYYSFGNLLLNENFNASTAGDPAVVGLPRFTISVAIPAGYAPTLINQGTDDSVDSDDPAGAVAVVVQGQTDNTFDFGFFLAGLPVAVDDQKLLNPAGTAVTVDVLDNDLPGDLPLDPTSVVIVGAPGDGKELEVPGEGVWTVDPNTGEITFTPEPGFDGDPTPIQYTVDDTLGNTSNPATVTITYLDLPVANDDEKLLNPIGSPVTVDVLDNDAPGDFPLDPTTVQIVGADPGSGGQTKTVPGEGTWTVDPNTGEITFTPEPTFTGDPTPIQYTVDDTQGNTSNPATVTITYTDPPVANDDESLGNPVGSPVTVNALANDQATDFPLVPATVQIVGTPNPGDPLTVPGEGTWTVNPTTGAITFTPEPGFTDNPTPIQYTVDDTQGNTSNPATVTISYTVPPVAVNDSSSNNPIGFPVTVDVLDNDIPGNLPLDPTSVVIVNPPPGSTLSPDGKTLTVPGEGEWTVNPTTGAITFTPEPGFEDNPTPIQYTVDDSQGNTSNPATVTILFTDQPVANNDQSLGNPIGSAVPVNVLLNDVPGDFPLNPTTVTIVNPPSGSIISPDGKLLLVPGQGYWLVNPITGWITFTPEPGYPGDPTPIQYTVKDTQGNTSNVATVTVTYTKPPVAVNDQKLLNPVGSAVTVPVLNNDSADVGRTLDPTSVVIVNPPPGSTLSPDGKTLTVPGEGVWTVNPTTGAITFTPEPGYPGDPTPIQYTVRDDQGNLSNIATVTITYSEPPTANNDTSSGNPVGSPVTIPVLGNDTPGDFPLDPSTVQIVGTPNPGDPLTVPGEGTWTVDPTTGAITFTPEPGFQGDPTPIQYTVDDTQGNTSNPATVTIDYTDPPVAVDDTSLNNPIGQPVIVNVIGNDIPTDLPIDPTTVQIVGTANPGDPLVVPGQGTWTVDPDTGAITFTPQPGFTGTPTPIQYTVDDTQGNTSNPATVSITFTGAPVAVNDSSLGNPVGSAVTLPVLDNDSASPGRTLNPTTVVIVGADPGSNGKTKTVPGEGVWTVNPTTGAITFTPEPGYPGDPTPIQYTVRDDQGNLSNNATVTITYTDPPVAVDDSSSNNPIGQPVTINVVGNDIPTDLPIDPTTVQIVGTPNPGDPLVVPGEGTWTVNPVTGAITFTPEPGFQGDPTPIQYTVDDTQGNASNPATVTIDYTDPPVAVDDESLSNPSGSVVTLPVLDNDSAAPGRTLNPTTVVIVGADPGSNGKTKTVPGQGVWTVNPVTGDITFTPDQNFLGDPTPIQYTVRDDQGNLSNPATVVITYLLPPVANDDSGSGAAGSPVTVDVLNNDTPGTAPLLPGTVQIVGTPGPGFPLIVPGEGLWTVDPTSGAITFTPQAGFTGNPTPIQYTVQDTLGQTSNPATVTITYTQVPDVTPVITAVPNVMTGVTPFNIYVQVTELNGANTVGLITVRIPKDSRWVLNGPFDPTLTTLGGRPVNNSVWAYSQNATQHIFTTTATIPANGFSTFGFRAIWDAGFTQGQYTITSQIDSGSGGENRIDNNSDAERLDYFIN